MSVKKMKKFFARLKNFIFNAIIYNVTEVF